AASLASLALLALLGFVPLSVTDVVGSSGGIDASFVSGGRPSDVGASLSSFSMFPPHAPSAIESTAQPTKTERSGIPPVLGLGQRFCHSGREPSDGEISLCDLAVDPTAEDHGAVRLEADVEGFGLLGEGRDLLRLESARRRESNEGHRRLLDVRVERAVTGEE